MFAKRKPHHSPRLEHRLSKMPLVDIMDWCDNNGTTIAKALDNIRKGDNKEVNAAEAVKCVRELHQAIDHIAKRLGILVDS